MEKIYANYHTHTKRCGHARGEDEEYVIDAIKNGIKIMGFSDHEEISIDYFYAPDKKATVDSYIQSILSLKEKYKDQINIHLGLESLYFPGKEEHFNKLVNKGIQYFILGQHDLLDENGNRDYFLSRPCTSEVVQRYTDLVCQGIKSGYFTYVAHPDLFMFRVDEITPEMIDCMYKICNTAKENDVYLEINLLGLTRKSKYTYPSEQFFKIVGEVGNKVVIGFDAHDPTSIEDRNVDYAFYLVEKYHLNLMYEIEFKDLSLVKN